MAQSATDVDYAVPAWFEPTITTILAPIRILLAKTRNFQLYNGNIIPYQIVPFNDGRLSLRTEAPHNLPPLVNAAAISALTAPQTMAYVAGYELGDIGTAAEGRNAIRRAVGCTVFER